MLQFPRWVYKIVDNVPDPKVGIIVKDEEAYNKLLSTGWSGHPFKLEIIEQPKAKPKPPKRKKKEL